VDIGLPKWCVKSCYNVLHIFFNVYKQIIFAAVLLLFSAIDHFMQASGRLTGLLAIINLIFNIWHLTGPVFPAIWW
jgi:hypothetical protein